MSDNVDEQQQKSSHLGSPLGLAHGIDIIEIQRISSAVNSWGTKFLTRIYTEREVEYCKGRAPELAARFAGKEAVMKALTTGHVGVAANEIEILPDERGVPSIHLIGRTSAKAHELGLDNLMISLSHSRDYAIASVIGNRI